MADMLRHGNCSTHVICVVPIKCPEIRRFRVNAWRVSIPIPLMIYATVQGPIQEFVHRRVYTVYVCYDSGREVMTRRQEGHRSGDRPNQFLLGHPAFLDGQTI